MSEPRYWGYARASRTVQETSPINQKNAILAWAESKGVAVEHVFMEHGSATNVPWNERPQLLDLMTRLRPGDHVVVWRLDRLDRKMLRLAELANRIIQKDVHLHCLHELGGEEMDFNSFTGKILIMALGIAAEFYVEQFKDASNRGRRAKKLLGYATNGRAPIGMRREEREIDGRVIKVDVWDSHQLEIIHEITARYRSGESFGSIAADFHRRKLKKANKGKNGRYALWAPRMPGGRINKTNVMSAYYKAENLEELGLELGSEEASRNGLWQSVPTKPFYLSAPEAKEKCLELLKTSCTSSQSVASLVAQASESPSRQPDVVGSTDG